MHLYGDNLQANQVVTVDGKMISADIKELDTDEGYVDIFLPVFDELTSYSQDSELWMDKENNKSLPTFSTEVKRLTGEVKIVELKVPME